MLLTKAALAGRLPSSERMRSGRVTSSCQRISAFNVRVFSEDVLREIDRKSRENWNEMATRVVLVDSCRLLGARRADWIFQFDVNDAASFGRKERATDDMVRETRYLWVANLPDSVNEDQIAEYFGRQGAVCLFG